MEPQPNILAKTRGYRDLLMAFRAYLEEKEITREALDDHAGLTAGYSSKLFAIPPGKNLGPTSLTLLLRSLGLELWLVEMPRSPCEEAPKRVRHVARKRAA